MINRKYDKKQTGNICCLASLLQKEESTPAPSCTDKGQLKVKLPSKGRVGDMNFEVASAKCTENIQNSSKTLISGIFHYTLIPTNGPTPLRCGQQYINQVHLNRWVWDSHLSLEEVWSLQMIIIFSSLYLIVGMVLLSGAFVWYSCVCSVCFCLTQKGVHELQCRLQTTLTVSTWFYSGKCILSCMLPSELITNWFVYKWIVLCDCDHCD